MGYTCKFACVTNFEATTKEAHCTEPVHIVRISLANKLGERSVPRVGALEGTNWTPWSTISLMLSWTAWKGKCLLITVTMSLNWGLYRVVKENVLSLKRSFLSIFSSLRKALFMVHLGYLQSNNLFWILSNSNCNLSGEKKALYVSCYVSWFYKHRTCSPDILSTHTTELRR